MDKEKAEAEFGDVMFSLINAARLYKINPDNALELTNQKFIRRFNYLEEHTIKEGKSLKDMSLEEMDAIWNEAKKKDCNFLTDIKKQRLYSHRTEPPFYSNRASVHTNRTLCFLYFFFESSPLSLLRFIPFIISR